MNRVLTAAVTAATVATCSVLWTTSARADTALVESVPTIGAARASVPDQVTLRFADPVSSDVTVIVQRPDGTLVPTEQSRVVGSTVRTATATATATVTSTDDTGRYVVSYRAVSADGHPATGQVPFQVAAAGPSAPRPSPTAGDVSGRNDQAAPDAARQVAVADGDMAYLLLLGVVLAAMVTGLILVAVRTGHPR
ncbi:copper resistance CopC family protein [Solicola sp. PLA-1-18]|uniref:copper resistance CopC family protein n=1 Tax=Solicola sp. PLA-1-18 TaxID=3380532 RepID=UPI003B809CF5